MRTLLSVQPHAQDRHAVEQRINRPQRAEKAAERPVDEHGSNEHRRRYQRLPGKQPTGLRAQVFVGDHQGDAALKRAYGTKPLAEGRGEHAIDREEVQRQSDHHHHQHYVFYNR